MFRFNLSSDTKPKEPKSDFFYSNYDINLYIELEILRILKEYDLNYDNEIVKLIAFQLVLNFKNGFLSLISTHEFEIAKRADILEGEDLIKDFVDLTNSVEWKEYFIRKYENIENKITNVLQQRILYVCDFLKNLFKDIDELNSKFHINATHNDITELELFKGDIHRKGKFVIYIKFKSEKILYFKPRDAYNEIFFDEFVTFLNTLGFYLDIEMPTMLSNHEYSWMSNLEYDNNFINREELEKFYSSLGKMLSVFHVLGSTDIIPDNIMISKNKIGLFDLECITSKPIIEKDNILRKFKESIIKTDSLTGFLSIDTEYDSYLISSIFFNIKNQVATYSKWNLETKEYEKITEKINFGIDTHVPFLKGNSIEFSDKEYKFVRQGFEEGYKFFIKNTVEIRKFLQLKKFTHPKKIRVIIHATSIYTQFLRESIVPEHIMNNEKLVDLINNLVNVSYNNGMIVKQKELANSIFSQLEINDIPFFYFDTETKKLLDGNGKCLSEKYWDNDFNSYLIERLESLNNNALQLQLNILDQTTNLAFDLFGAEYRLRNNIIEINGIDFLDKKKLKDRSELLSASIKIGDDLINKSITHNNTINWIGKVSDASNKYSISLHEYDLYNGLSGFCLFYIQLYRLTKDKKYSEVAIKIFEELCSVCMNRNKIGYYKNLSDEIIEQTPVSPYYFPSSILYLFFQNEILQRTEKSRKIIPLLIDDLYYIVDKTKHNDYLLGKIGLLSLLFDIKNLIPNIYFDKIELLIKLCIKKLEKDVTKTAEMEYWMALDANSFKDFGGFAHGSSASSFITAKIKKGYSFDISIDKNLNHDRSFFKKEINGWYDNREGITKTMDASVWCHGSAGIALGRLLISNYYTDELIEKELLIAKNNIINNGIGYNQCICHGDLGNLEVLYALARKDGDVKLQDQIQTYIINLSQKILKGIELRGGTEGTTECLGLFTGTLGYAYQFLRFYDWENVPSVLSVEVPENLNSNLHE